MKGEFSMQSVRTLFRLDLKSRFGSVQKIGVSKRIMQILGYVFFAAIYALLIVGIYFLTNMFVEKSGLRLEYLVMIATATILIATAIATSTVVKNLYQNGDNEMLLRFPVSGKEILLSKSIYCFLHNFVVCVLMMLPFYISFGAVTDAPAGDYFAYLGVILISTLFPYSVANIIAVPVMKIMNKVKNQFLLVLIFTIIAICAVFVLYLTSLGNVLEYMKDSEQNIFSKDVIGYFQAFANNAYPFKWYAELINGKVYSGLSGGQMALRCLYIFLLNAALAVGAYFVTTRQYYKTILYGIETQKASFTKKVKDKQHSQPVALFRREFYLILRSFNYSFQYFAMACAAPVMVFFCNRLACTMGTESVGAGIMPGLTLMVIVIFVAIIVSFASTCISREGDSFYHTKIIPVSYTTQVLVKFVLYAAVAAISVSLSCLVSGVYYTSETGGQLLTPLDVGAIFGISLITVISLTCLSMIADIKSPTFNVGGDGEMVQANKNLAIALIVGIVVAALYGIFAMVCSFLPLQIGSWVVVQAGNMEQIYGVLSIFSILLLIGSVLGLFINLNKRYLKLIP